LNNEFSLNRAKAFAARVADKAGAERERQIEMAFMFSLGRLPDERDRAAARRFFQTHGEDNALAHFCQALLNVNEFVYIE
jgi:hypothetical protein